MKVVSILEAGRYGGTNKRIKDVAVALKKNYDVETLVVFGSENSEIYANILQRENVSYRILNLNRFRLTFIRVLKYFVFFIPEVLMLIRLFKKEKPDIVHVNAVIDLKGIIAAKILNIPAIWHVSTSSDPLLIKKLFAFLRKFFKGNYIAPSQAAIDFHLDQSYVDQRKAKIIPVPVQTDFFTPSQQIEDPEIYINNNSIKIVSISNVHPGKGFDVLINATAKVMKNISPNTKVEVFIVGKVWPNHQTYFEGLKKMLQEESLDNVHFMGRSDDIRIYLNSADIFVCASHAESGPIVVVEAMAMNLPVVCTDVGFVKSIFEKYDCGIVVPIKDSDKMADAMIELITNNELRKEMGENGYKAVKEIFDVNSVAKETYQWYQNTIDKYK